VLGFGSLATAIGQFADREHRRAFDVLRGSLLAGFALAIGGVLPSVVLAHGVAPSLALRIAAIVMLPLNLGVTYYALRWSVVSNTTLFDKNCLRSSRDSVVCMSPRNRFFARIRICSRSLPPISCTTVVRSNRLLPRVLSFRIRTKLRPERQRRLGRCLTGRRSGHGWASG